MILIAYSTTAHTDWVLLDGDEVVAQAETEGLNPVFHSRREISHIVRLQLPAPFFRKHWDQVYFYGAGCFSEDMKKVVESSLIAQFKSRTEVQSDLLGVARGLLGHDAGLAAILSTGSNACYYNGQEIEQSVIAGGYMLGDEGSAAYIGRRIVSDVIKQLAPAEIITRFYAKYTKSASEIVSSVYESQQPSEELAKYAQFVSENLSNEYCRKLVYDSLMDFFKRNISQFEYADKPLHILGHTALAFEPVLRQAAADFGVQVASIDASCMPGLIDYHKESE